LCVGNLEVCISLHIIVWFFLPLVEFHLATDYGKFICYSLNNHNHQYSLCLCPRVVLLSRKQFSREILPKLVEKTKKLYILFALAYYYSIIASFDLWMSKGAYDIFALVIKIMWRLIGSQNILQLGFLKHLIPLGMH
jgi:hypothetical protein